MQRLLRKGVERSLPAGYDVDTHFKPRYDPWDQRLCFVPDGDLFEAIASGRASVVTDRIETFTERGVTLASGSELEADVVVTATGLNLLALGGIALRSTARGSSSAETVGYKGMMLSGVPNLALTLGYTNASWTLKADLVARIRLPAAQPHGRARLRPLHARAPDPSLPTHAVPRPQIGLRAALDRRSCPSRAPRAPWRLNQNYPLDVGCCAAGRSRTRASSSRAHRGPVAAARRRARRVTRHRGAAPAHPGRPDRDIVAIATL